MAVFGHKLQFLKLRSATCESLSRPPPSSFLLKLCVIVLLTHRYHAPKFHPNLKHHNGVLIFYPFRACCCLLAACQLACLLAAAKPGRSTLDTKKGYKTKTGSTGSVTLALALTPEGGQGEVTEACATPPPPTSNCPTWTPPKTDPPELPPFFSVSFCLCLPGPLGLDNLPPTSPPCPLTA